MSIRIWIILTLLAIVGGRANANIIISHSGNGTLVSTVTPVAGTTNEFDIVVIVRNMSPGGIANVDITSNASDIIRISRFEAWTTSSTGVRPLVLVSFLGNSATQAGAIESVEIVNWNPPLPGDRAANISIGIELDPTAGSGRIGNPEGTGRLRAMSFRSLTCREFDVDIEPPPGFSPGSITTIDVDGDIAAGIQVEASSIALIQVEGDIGVSGATLPRFDVDGDLDTIIASNIYADFNIGGAVETVLVFGSGDPSTAATDAVFAGGFDCDVLAGGDGIRVWGDLTANVNIEQTISGVDTRIAIGRELSGNLSVDVSGFSNQGVTIGWMPSATGLWTGNITVGTTPLSPKGAYTQTSTGDGAVGLAPHGLHRHACDPAYNPGYPIVSPSSSQTIDLVHYGKVRLVPSTGIPYTVYEAAGSHCDGTCIHGLLIDVTSSAPWSLVGVSDRTATISGPIVAGKHYHIVLIEDSQVSPAQHLETNDLFGSQRDIPSYVYIIGTQ